MNQLTKYKWLLLLIVLAGSLCFYVFRKEFPNVVLVFVDDLNDFVVDSKASNKVITPNLDRLKSKSLVFINAHSPATLCNPSRAAILTGKEAFHTGIYNNYHDSVKALMANETLVTIYDRFREAGYYIFNSGKIFHKSDPFLIQPDLYWSWFYEEKPDLDHKWGDYDNESKMSDTKVVDFANSILNAEYEKPFFLSVGLSHPHIPWFLPQKYFDLYDLNDIEIDNYHSDWDDIPEYAKKLLKTNINHYKKINGSNNLKEFIRAYMASVSYMDSQLGRLLDSLENGPNAHNTILVFVSDHGFHLGEKSILRKGSLWDRATRVPLIVYDPREKLNANNVEALVSTLDIYQTLLDMAGLKSDESSDGISLKKYFADPYENIDRDIYSVADFMDFSVRNQDWTFIRYSDGFEELYDNNLDKKQLNNLAKNINYSDYLNLMRNKLPRNIENAVKYIDREAVDD